MSAPSTVSNLQSTALQGLQQRHALGRGHETAGAPSQNQISFANLVSSLQGSATGAVGTAAASPSTAATSVGSTASAASGTASASDGSDLASLLEALLSGNVGNTVSSATQMLTQPQTDTKSQHSHHQHAGNAAQVNGVNDAGSSAVSAYSTMNSAGSQATPSAAVSTRV
jgi:hypothetical protein